MRGKVTLGTVLFCPNFRMPDGLVRDKILLVLGAKRGAQYFCAATTTQQRNRHAVRGCHRQPSAHFFIPAAEDSFFIEDTWLILSDPVTISKIAVSQKIAKGAFRVVGKLNNRLTREILACQKLSGDIHLWQRRLLT